MATSAGQSGAFGVVPGDPASTVVLHVPHASTHVPADVRAGIALDDAALAAEIAAITDARTDEVAAAAADAARVRPWLWVNRTSRLVVDPERFVDGSEELDAVGMGAVYTRTTSGEVLRSPTAAQRQALLDRYFTPYAEGFAALVTDRLAVVGRVTILDVHSFPLRALPYELRPQARRPEVCLGSDDVHTPGWLRDAALRVMREVAPSGDVAWDEPFAGCYVPLDRYGVDRSVSALMLELRRDVVQERLDVLAAGVARLVDACA